RNASRREAHAQGEGHHVLPERGVGGVRRYLVGIARLQVVLPVVRGHVRQRRRAIRRATAGERRLVLVADLVAVGVGETRAVTVAGAVGGGRGVIAVPETVRGQDGVGLAAGDIPRVAAVGVTRIGRASCRER